MGAVHAPVGKNQDGRAVGDRLIGAFTKLVQRALQAGFAVVGIEQNRQRRRLDARQIDLSELDHIRVAQNRIVQAQLPATLRRGLHQIAFGADRQRRRSDQFFADRIDGRIGHLSEQLFKIVVEQLRLVR